MPPLSEDHEPVRLPRLRQGMSDRDDSDLFSFAGSVGPNGDNRREDVIRAQLLLRHSGDFDPGGIFKVPTGWPSSDLYRGIRAFQKRAGKMVDGTLPWRQSQSALQRQLPDSPVLRSTLGRIYAEEGGRIRDPRGTAAGGLTAGTLREPQEKGLLPDVPKDATPQSLTPDQQIAAYRAYIDQAMRHVGGAKALETLDSDFAHAIADAMFMHGSAGGGGSGSAPRGRHRTVHCR